jgi:single-strand DNA-binding protein
VSDLNSYSFTGRLGADAEVRTSNSGTAIWSARVGVGYGYGDNKETNWITVKAFGKRAEGLAKLELQKGAAIGGAGELQHREYERKDGGKGYALEVTVNDIALLGGKPESRSGGGSTRQEPSRETFADDDPSDIPFITNAGTF